MVLSGSKLHVSMKEVASRIQTRQWLFEVLELTTSSVLAREHWCDKPLWAWLGDRNFSKLHVLFSEKGGTCGHAPEVRISCRKEWIILNGARSTLQISAEKYIIILWLWWNINNMIVLAIGWLLYNLQRVAMSCNGKPRKKLPPNVGWQLIAQCTWGLWGAINGASRKSLSQDLIHVGEAVQFTRIEHWRSNSRCYDYVKCSGTKHYRNSKNQNQISSNHPFSNGAPPVLHSAMPPPPGHWVDLWRTLGADGCQGSGRGDWDWDCSGRMERVGFARRYWLSGDKMQWDWDKNWKVGRVFWSMLSTLSTSSVCLPH